jgi:microcin C transport system permease protein
LETPTEYSDPEVQEMIQEKGWIMWPPVRFSYDTVNYGLT